MNYVENERTGSGCSWGPDAARLGWDVPEMRSHSWGQVMLPLCELPPGPGDPQEPEGPQTWHSEDLGTCQSSERGCWPFRQRPARMRAASP